jgi:hypothetical protein
MDVIGIVSIFSGIALIAYVVLISTGEWRVKLRTAVARRSVSSIGQTLQPIYFILPIARALRNASFAYGRLSAVP